MKFNLLLQAMLRGIPTGLALAVALMLFRTLLSGVSFSDTARSLYGMLMLLCFPIGFAYMSYEDLRKKEEAGKPTRKRKKK